MSWVKKGQPRYQDTIPVQVRLWTRICHQFKACLEWHGIIKLYNWFFFCVFKHKGLQLRYWHCQAILGCLGWSTGQPQWNLKMAEFGEKSSLYEQHLLSRSYLLNFYIRKQYHRSQYELFMSKSLSISKLFQNFT